MPKIELPKIPLAVMIAGALVTLVLVLASVVVGVGVIKAWWGLPFGPLRVDATQPIQFPHDAHTSDPRVVVDGDVTDPASQISLDDALVIQPAAGVGDVVGAGIDCLFCHRTVNTDEAASFPAVQQCLFCHQVVKKDSPEVAKLITAAETDQPINWVRVHRLPDHVQFVHEAHILFFSEQNNIAPSQACSICHGEVQTMKVAEQVRSLKMGDCVDCHRSGYLSYLTDEARDRVETEVEEGRLKGPPTDCAACHY